MEDPGVRLQPEVDAALRQEVRRQFRSGKSLLRSFMNAHLATIEIPEQVLDLGAGRVGSASYHECIPNFANKHVTSVDISLEKQPTVIADIESRLPLRSATFDACLIINLLEHIYRFEEVVSEARRVLSPGGEIVLAVPFLLRVHGDPFDFFRYTEGALKRTLTNAGFGDIRTEACGAGPFTAALSQVDFVVPAWLRSFSLRSAVAIDRRIGKRSKSGFRNGNDYPLGYVVRARAN